MSEAVLQSSWLDGAGRSTSVWLDRFVTLCVWGVAAVVTAVFVCILGDLVWHGIGRVSWSYIVDLPRDAGRAGGIGPMIVSTGLILMVCLAVSVPVGLGTAVLLAEFSSQHRLFGVLVRRSLDVLAGVPSIVFGLFGSAFFCVYLGMGYSILAGGLTLSCMVLPILIRSVEAGIRSVPEQYRLGAAALGLTRGRALWHLLLPAASPGVVVGLVLGIGRAIAETAALIFTSGYVTRMPESLLDSGRSLSIHIYDLSMNVAGGDGNAYATALILVVCLLAINWVASVVTDGCLCRRLVRA